MKDKKISFKIDGKEIKENGRVFVIAEAGVNHNGKLDLALNLVDMAADIGADAVKFQSFRPENVVTPEGKIVAYQLKNIGEEITQLEFAKRLVLPYEFHKTLIERCKKRKILFFSTPHGGRESIDFLESLKVSVYKIGSGDLTNYILLDHIAKLKKPVIISTGMADLKESIEAVKFIKSRGNNKIAVLHCTTNYPCPYEDVNLSAMKTMMDIFDVPVGYSDHTIGDQVAMMSTAMGASIYEFHITLDKKLPGPDQRASADFNEAVSRVKAVRLATLINGNSKKIPNKNEILIRGQVRRHLVAAHDLVKGQVIELKDLEALRPMRGTSPTIYEKFIGKKLKKDFKRTESITLKDVSKK
jgi:N,N'-diacetyllegionaminate synthase